jgi:hypothetical protein
MAFPFSAQSKKNVPGEIFGNFFFIEKGGTKEFLSKRYRNRPKEGKASGEKIPQRIFLVTEETEDRRNEGSESLLKRKFCYKINA